MKLRTVLSLFDGMSCGRLALDKAGIEYDTYYASEIDKYAIKVAIHNYPDTVELGDINSWKEWSVDWSKVDLILAGSPCQGFSFAGKQLAFDDPRSRLFFVFVDILNHVKTVNPKVKFLLENVVMKQEFKEIITQQVGVEPVLINSALVSAQNRRRLYWANWSFGQPEDKGILLKDIIETEADFNSVILKGRYAEWWEKNKDFQLGKKYSSLDADKAICMTARQYASWNGNYVSIFQKPRGNNHGGVRAKDGKTPCMSANSWQDNNHLVFKAKSQTILSTIYKENAKSMVKRNKLGLLVNDSIVRKLTTVECERLQTVPDNYTAHVSNTQRYRMLGNGWTVDVIAHILSSIDSGEQNIKQMRLNYA